MFPCFKLRSASSVQKVISFTFLVLLTGFLFVASNIALADTTEDAVEGAGQLSKFGIDVLEDFGLEGKSSEDTGKDRLKDFLKGKATSFIKDHLTGGDDLSEGMGLILNRIFDGIDATSRERANRCTTVAYNQAWGIAFDAKNTRLLRGAANVWFDVLTSIPGVPALAEQLVMETGKAAYKKLRSQIEDKIKEWWAKQKDEAFKLTKHTDSCTINMTVLWNKKKGKYLFLISGKCDCKLLSTGRGGSVTMKSFEIIGGGSVAPNIDLSDPNNPKVKINAGRVSNIHVNADCNCATGETRLPPPKEDPIDEWTTAPRMEARVTEAKCEACQPLLDTAIGLVSDFNKVADKMDALGKEIVAERYKTPERDANIKEWEELSKQQDAIEKKHDEVFQKFAECEEEECKLGTDPFQLPHTSDKSKTSTTCKECESIVAEINGLVEKYNVLAKDMNILADAARRSNMKHGTVEGNKTYKKWHELSKQATDLSGQISRKKTEQSQCEATHCFGLKPYKKVELSSACDACSDIQQRTNAAEKKYNAMVDKINELNEKYRQFLINGGDASSVEGNELSHAPIKLFDEFNKLQTEMGALQLELNKCVLDKCNATEDGTRIKIGEDFGTKPEEGGTTTAGGIGSLDTGQQSAVTIGGGAKVPQQVTESVIDELSTGPGGIYEKVSTACKPCQKYTQPINKAIIKAMDLEWEWSDLEKDGPKQIDAEVKKLEQQLDPDINKAKATMDQRAKDLRTARSNLLDNPGNSQLVKAEKTANNAFRDARTEVERLQRQKQTRVDQLRKQLEQQLKDRIAKLGKERDDLVSLIKDLKSKLKACVTRECPDVAKKEYRIGEDVTPLPPSGEGDKKIKIGEDGQPIKPEDKEKKPKQEEQTPDNKKQSSLLEGKKIKGVCLGSSCSEDFTVICGGDGCPDTFTLNCGGDSCPENVQLDCVDDTCTDETILDCDTDTCLDPVEFVCIGNQCNDVTPVGAGTKPAGEGEGQTTHPSSGVKYDPETNSLSEGHFGYVYPVYRKVSTSCQPCQPLVTQINALIDKLGALDKEYETAETHYDNAGTYQEKRDVVVNEIDPIRRRGEPIDRSLKQLMQKLRLCVKQCSGSDRIVHIGDDFILGPGPGYKLDWGPTSGYGAGTETEAGGITAGSEGTALHKITTACAPCEHFAEYYNKTLEKIADLQSQLRTAVREQKKAKETLDSKGPELIKLNTMDPAKFEDEYFDAADDGYTYDGYKQAVQEAVNKAQAKLAELSTKITDLKKQIEKSQAALGKFKKDLAECEKQCTTVKVRDVISISGNNPYDRRDPIAEDSENTQIGGNEATVQVINNIPISRLSLSGADAGCPNPNGEHYHGSADNCNGVFTPDPAPGGCGQGRTTSVITIPVSACPDL